MMRNVATCNHCAGTIVLSLNEHVVVRGLTFCSHQCSEDFYKPDNPEPEPIGLIHDLENGHG